VKIDLRALVREVAEDADFEARSRDRSVRMIRDEASEIFGVPELVRSAIENVVRNAVRYTAAGSRWIFADRRKTNGDRYALIIVRDRGNVFQMDQSRRSSALLRVEDDRDRKTEELAGIINRRARRAATSGMIKASNAKDVLDCRD